MYEVFLIFKKTKTASKNSNAVFAFIICTVETSGMEPMSVIQKTKPNHMPLL